LSSVIKDPFGVISGRRKWRKQERKGKERGRKKYPLDRRLGGPQGGLGAVENRIEKLGIEPRSFSLYPIPIPTELSRNLHDTAYFIFISFII
jgi:hypothetical protein